MAVGLGGHGDGPTALGEVGGRLAPTDGRGQAPAAAVHVVQLQEAPRVVETLLADLGQRLPKNQHTQSTSVTRRTTGHRVRPGPSPHLDFRREHDVEHAVQVPPTQFDAGVGQNDLRGFHTVSIQSLCFYRLVRLFFFFG